MQLRLCRAVGRRSEDVAIADWREETQLPCPVSSPAMEGSETLGIGESS